MNDSRNLALRRIGGCWLAFVFSVASQSPGLFADDPKQANPEDPDIVVQGEYEGQLAEGVLKDKVGLQVIALGKSQFRTVGYIGGLPGIGRDASDILQWKGSTSNGVTAFEGSGYRAHVDGDSIVVDAGAVGKLKKVHRRSPTLDAKPPRGAITLFDGTNVDSFENGRMTSDHLLMTGTTTRTTFQNGTLHVEFQIPFAPLVASRGNSGVYLQSRYEVQILDSMGFAPHNHECGGIPSVKAAGINMSFPPLAWQTYDIDFSAAQFRAGKKEVNAHMSVRHNGVVIHDNVEIPNATTSAPLAEGAEPGPITFQEHGAEVRFRNIWYLPRES